MGRRDKSFSKDLHQQAYDKLTAMQAFGESKRAAIINGTAKDKIFSFCTYETYWKHVKYFIKYIQINYPECTTLKAAKRHVNEWLELRESQGLSAWTVQTEAKALGKLYGIQPDDEDYFAPPKRKREDIKRSRGDKKRDKHFSEANNDELVKFCRGTGLRRSELEALKGKDLVIRAQIERRISQLEQKGELTQYEMKQLGMLRDTRLFDMEYYTYVRNGKGGRERVSPIVGKNTDAIIRRMMETSREEKVWQYVNQNADIHGYRADYATFIYRQYARPIEDIPYDKRNKGTGKAYQSEVYTCRKDEAGKKLDRLAMIRCSKALGHNRISIVANNYIRGL